jgi:hypothetical protein
MRRELIVTVDCDGGLCGSCKFLDGTPLCDLFNDPAGDALFILLEADADDQAERCPACLAAERARKVP